MSRHVSTHQMRWADVDAYGHVNNVVFLRYMQEARVDMLYVHAPAQGAERLASGVVIVSNEVEYLEPLPLSPEPVTVRTWVTGIGAARFGLAYEIRGSNPDRLAARAATTVTPFDVEARRPRRLEPIERAVLERNLHPELPRPRSKEPQGGPGIPGPLYSYACAVRFDDLDLYGHVNNVTYVEYLQEARIRLAAHDRVARPTEEGHVVVHLAVSYRQPIPFRTVPVTVDSRVVGLSPRTWTLDQVVRDGDRVFATARSTMVAYDMRRSSARVLTPRERDFLVGPA